MKPDTSNDEPIKHDEDVKFELEKEPAIAPTENQEKNQHVGETIIPPKEDTLGNSDFPPLTKKDKEPKLPDLE